MIKFENSTLKIYIRNISKFIQDIDPTVDFVFPVNKKITKTVKN
jgi:hypothetical protein